MIDLDEFEAEATRVGDLPMPRLRDEWCLCTLDTETKNDVKMATRGASRGELIAGVLRDWLERNDRE